MNALGLLARYGQVKPDQLTDVMVRELLPMAGINVDVNSEVTRTVIETLKGGDINVLADLVSRPDMLPRVASAIMGPTSLKLPVYRYCGHCGRPNLYEIEVPIN